MKVFLSTKWEDGHYMVNLRENLTQLGFTVVSTWLDHLDWNDGDQSQWSNHAVLDMNEIKECDVFVQYNRPNTVNQRGSAYSELGSALALGKLCVVIGDRPNIFHHHPEVWYEPSMDSFLRFAEAVLWTNKFAVADE